MAKMTMKKFEKSSKDIRSDKKSGKAEGSKSERAMDRKERGGKKKAKR